MEDSKKLETLDLIIKKGVAVGMIQLLLEKILVVSKSITISLVVLKNCISHKMISTKLRTY